MRTIKKLQGCHVRIKREYIKLSEPQIDTDLSTYDDDYNIIEEVYEKPHYYIDTENGMNSVFQYDYDWMTKEYRVLSEFFGVDLYSRTTSAAEPSHHIIVDVCKHPYSWDAKYFEVVNWYLDNIILRYVRADGIILTYDDILDMHLKGTLVTISDEERFNIDEHFDLHVDFSNKLNINF